MGIRSYVRDRKQVKASRAGEASEKLSKGDFSIFGGKNGASIDPFDPRVDIQDMRSSKSFGVQPASGYSQPLMEKTYPAAPKSEVEAPNYPKNADSFDDANHDKFTDMPSYRRGTSLQQAEEGPETLEQEAARGARMAGPAGVTVLGPKKGLSGERYKIDGETRGRVRANIANAKQRGESSDNEDYLPTKEDVERVKREDSKPKPKPRMKAWDED
jgi:hypothetical protein